MRIPLRLFLARFNRAVENYSLVRLEAVLRNPGISEAPVLHRLGKPGADGKTPDSWPQTRRSVDALQRYIGAVKKGKIRLADDATRQRLTESGRQVIELKNSIETMHLAHGRGRAR